MEVTARLSLAVGEIGFLFEMSEKEELSEKVLKLRGRSREGNFCLLWHGMNLSLSFEKHGKTPLRR